MKKIDRNDRVINLTKAREEKNEQKRREYERVLFKNIVGAYCVIEDKGLQAIELVDLSMSGLSFQVPHDNTRINFEVGSHFSFRLYFSQTTFLPLMIKIVYKRSTLENGAAYVRYGCEVDTKLASYKSYTHLVQFLATYAEYAKEDKSPTKLFFF
jgi:hypothetical protein